MRWLVLALVAACSQSENPEDKRVPPKQPRFAVDAFVPSYSDDPPWDASEIDAPTVEAGPVTITLPSHPGAPLPAGILAVARVANGYRKVAAATLAVTGDTVAIPVSESIDVADIARAATPTGVLVIAPATSPIDEEIGFALANECWTFASIDKGALVASWPKPCPAVVPDGKDVPQVVVVIAGRDPLTNEGQGFGVTSPRDVVKTAPLDDILARLRATKATKAFAKRTDLLFTTRPDVTVGGVLPVLAQIHAIGFTGTRWVPPVWIPLSFDNGVGFEPPPPPPPVGLTPLGVPRPPPVQVTVTVGGSTPLGKSPLVADEVDRVVRSRAGIWRACYQKELGRTPGIQGALNLVVDVGPGGEVTQASAIGSLRNEAVQVCIRGNFMRLRFPPKGTAGRFKVSLTFRSS